MDPKLLSHDPKNGSHDSAFGSFASSFSLFGPAGKTAILVLIAGLGRSFPRELAAITTLPLSTILRYVDDFDRGGVCVSVRLGRSREVRLNPDWFAARELRTLLEALIERDPAYQKLLAQAARRRPRRREKPI